MWVIQEIVTETGPYITWLNSYTTKELAQGVIDSMVKNDKVDRDKVRVVNWKNDGRNIMALKTYWIYDGRWRDDPDEASVLCTGAGTIEEARRDAADYGDSVIVEVELKDGYARDIREVA